MTQDNAAPNLPDDPGLPKSDAAATPPAPKKRKRWLILKIAGVLVAVLLLLILFAPTIASTGFVRQSVLERVNASSINGHLDIDDWSIGWTTGMHAHGIHLVDSNNSHVAEIKDLTTSVSLLKATMGNIELGDTRIDGVDGSIRRYKDGQLNISQIFKTKSPTEPTNKPGKLPNISGKIQLSNVTGTFQDDQSGQTLNVQSVDGTVTIKNINQPIEDRLDVKAGLLHQQAGEVKIDGTVAAIQNNQVDVDHATATQTITLANLDSAAVNGFLRDQKIDVKMAGLISGSVKIDVNTMNNVAANGTISVDQFAVDQVHYKHISIPIAASYSGTAIKADVPLVADEDHVDVHVDLPAGSMKEMVNVFASVAAKFLKQESVLTSVAVAGGGTGAASISANVNIAPILSSSGDLIHLDKAVNITGGRLICGTNLKLQNGVAVVSAESHLKDVTGTKNGNPIRLQNLDAAFAISAVGGAAPDLKDFKLDVNSAFLKIKGAGDTLNHIAIDGTGSLQELQKETASFVDWNGRQIGGKLDIHAQSNGDPTAANSALSVIANGGLTDFSLTGGPGAAVHVGAIQFTADARRDANGFGPVKPVALNLTDISVQTKDEMGLPQTAREPIVSITLAGHGTVNGNVTDLKGLVVTMTGGPESSRWLDLLFSADANITQQVAADGTKTSAARAPKIALDRMNIDLAKLQAEFGPILASFKTPEKPGAVAAAEVVTTATTQTKASVLDLLSHEILVISSGKAAATFNGSYDGSTLKMDKPLTVLVTDLVLKQPGGPNGGEILNEPLVRAIVGGTIGMENQSPAGAKDFSVAVQVGQDATPTVAINFNADLAFQSVHTHDINGRPITQMAVYAPHFQLTRCMVDLGRAQNEFAPTLALVMGAPTTAPSIMDRIAHKRIIATGGALTATASGTYTQAGFVLDNSTAINLDHVTLNNLDEKGTQPIVDQSVHMTAGASANADFTSIQNASVNVDSSFAKVALSNASLLLATMHGNTRVASGTLDMLQSAHLKIEKGDVPRLYAMMALMQPPIAAVPAGAEAPIAPLEVSGGVLSTDADIARQGSAMTVNVGSFDIAGLAIHRGKAAYTWPQDITAKLAASMDTKSDSTGKAAILDQLGRLSVTALAADFGVAKVSLADQKPINISDFGDAKKMTAQGGIAITGDVASTCRLAEIMTGAPANSYSYTGNYQFNESIAKDADRARIVIVGGGVINNFQVLSNPGTPTQAVTFSEQKIDISNPLEINPQSSTLLIDKAKPITIAMTSSGALTIKISGNLQQAQTLRVFDNFKIATNYDLEKLWKIIYPMLSPAMQLKLKDAVVSGKFQKNFLVRGNYPAGKPFSEAIKTVDTGGALALATCSASGVNITSVLDEPVTVHAGHLRTVDANGHSMTPAACNGGTIDLGTIDVDLTDPNMPVTIENISPEKPLAMLKGVSINPTFAKTVLAQYLNNPVFAGATQSQGTIDLNILQCRNVPLSAMATQNVPANKGVADVKYSILGLTVGNPVIEQIATLAGGRADSFTNCEIRDATVHYEHGQVIQDMTMTIAKTNNLRVNGTVLLASREFQPMNLSLPVGLLGNLIPENVKQYMPDAVSLPLVGTMDHPQLESGKVIQNLVQDASKKALVNGLLGGNKAKDGATSQPSQSNPLDDLLKGLNKPKKEGK